MNKNFEIASDNIIKSKAYSKNYYDRNVKENVFKPGDFVYLQNKITKKLSSNYKGPFEILEVYENKTVKRLLNNNKTAVYHHNLLKPFLTDNDCNVSTHSNPN